MNGINGIGSNWGMYQGTHKPGPTQSAQSLFSQLDRDSQGYIEKSDLQTAFDKITSLSTSSTTQIDESNIDALFSELDNNGDGKVTQQEFTDSLVKIDEQVQEIFAQLRKSEAMDAMPPPPPPPLPDAMNGEDEGFTLEELTAQLEEIGSSDSKRANFISTIIENFEEADTDGDGKVNLQEAMSFNQSTEETNRSVSASETDNRTRQGLDEKALLQLIRLLDAYSLADTSESSDTSSLSVSV